MAVLALVAAFAAARGPLHRATLALPVSNDDAILLLMGRHVLEGELATTLWNQPYNGPSTPTCWHPSSPCCPHQAAYRLYQLLGAALSSCSSSCWPAGWAARSRGGWGRFSRRGTPYMALMTATGRRPTS